MAVSNTPVFVQTPGVGTRQLTTGVGSTAPAVIVTAGSNGTKVVSCTAASNSTVAHVVAVGISTLSTPGASQVYWLGSTPLAAVTSTGLNATDLFSGSSFYSGVGMPVDNDGQKYIFVDSGYYLVAINSTLAAYLWSTVLPASGFISVTAIYGSF